MDPLDNQDILALQEPREIVAYPIQGWFTLAGGGPLTPPLLEQNWSMREELLGVATITKVVDLTFCAYQMILNMLPILLEFKDIALSLE